MGKWEALVYTWYIVFIVDWACSSRDLWLSFPICDFHFPSPDAKQLFCVHLHAFLCAVTTCMCMCASRSVTVFVCLSCIWGLAVWNILFWHLHRRTAWRKSSTCSVATGPLMSQTWFVYSSCHTVSSLHTSWVPCPACECDAHVLACMLHV